jgi:hypothetical protein
MEIYLIMDIFYLIKNIGKEFLIMKVKILNMMDNGKMISKMDLEYYLKMIKIIPKHIMELFKRDLFQEKALNIIKMEI